MTRLSRAIAPGCLQELGPVYVDMHLVGLAAEPD
jgi:hypothetical protein